MAVVIVTGGAGFIGSETVERLVAEDYYVVVVDDFYSGSLDNIAKVLGSGRVDVVKADVSDFKELRESLEGVLRSGDVVGIVHLAAMINVVEVAENPRRAFEVNVLGTVNLLELSRLFDVERFVFASSVAVYGEPRGLPLREDHPLEPANLYGLTKKLSEEILWMWAREYGVKPVALRYFNVYGPRMRPGPYAGVVYRFIVSLLRGFRPVIYGDGLQTRDFVYVSDVAEANLLALKSKYVGPLNICSGVETSIIELYSRICSMFGWCPAPEFSKPRPGDVRRSVGDNSLARRVLGWQPQTPLNLGLQRTIEYYASRL